jgi:putative hydrolase of the HAD superfamily
MIKKNKVEHIFFDLDHTLWDFERNSAATFQYIFKELDFKFSLKNFLEFYDPINHFYWKQYRENKISEVELRFLRLEKTFGKMNIPHTSELIQKVSDLYIQKLSTHTFLFDNTIEVLKYLDETYSLHIITNGFENVQQRKLENSGIDHFFKVVLTAEKVGVKKPNPIIFKEALRSADALPENSLMIGDSLEADVQTPLELGMQAIHFNSHHEKVHTECLIINRLYDLTKIL